MPDDNMGNLPDLTDPKKLVEMLTMVADTLRQQAQAAQPGTAMSGHPYPAQFYATAEWVNRAAIKFVEQYVPKPAPEPPASPPPPPAEGGKGKNR